MKNWFKKSSTQASCYGSSIKPSFFSSVESNRFPLKFSLVWIATLWIVDASASSANEWNPFEIPCVSRYLNVGNWGFVRPSVEHRDLNLPFTGANYHLWNSAIWPRKSKQTNHCTNKPTQIIAYKDRYIHRRYILGCAWVDWWVCFSCLLAPCQKWRGFCRRFMSAVICWSQKSNHHLSNRKNKSPKIQKEIEY